MTLFSGAGKTDVVLGDGCDFVHIGGHVLLDPASGAVLAERFRRAAGMAPLTYPTQ